MDNISYRSKLSKHCTFWPPPFFGGISCSTAGINTTDANNTYCCTVLPISKIYLPCSNSSARSFGLSHHFLLLQTSSSSPSDQKPHVTHQSSNLWQKWEEDMLSATNKRISGDVKNLAQKFLLLDTNVVKYYGMWKYHLSPLKEEQRKHFYCSSISEMQDFST